MGAGCSGSERHRRGWRWRRDGRRPPGGWVNRLPAPYMLATGAATKPKDVPRLALLMSEALIFPSAKRTTPLSDMALSAVIRRMNAARPEGAPAPLPRLRLAEGNGAGPGSQHIFFAAVPCGLNLRSLAADS